MSTRIKNTDIELRSEEVQDILSRAPVWMIKWGNTLLVLIICIGFALSYFIKYPDVVAGRAIISTNVPPVFVKSNASGRLAKMFFENGSNVKEGELLAEIDNPVPSTAIDSLRVFLKSASLYMKDSSRLDFREVNPSNLFDATPNVLRLRNYLEDYNTFIFDQGAMLELNDLENKLKANLEFSRISKREATLNELVIKNAKEKFEMIQEEYKLGYVTKLRFLNAESDFNQSLKQEESIKRSVIMTELAVEDLKGQIRYFRINRELSGKSQRQKIQQEMASLENYVIKWNNDYAVKSPANGKINFLGRLKVNQLITKGDPLFAVIPPSGEFETILEIPVQGAGKVKIGQKVRLKIDNYPHTEFGVVYGTVSGIALLPRKDIYQVKVFLEKGLMTSYKIPLDYGPEMQGTAEVVTEDLRLIQRLFNSLRSILDQ